MNQLMDQKIQAAIRPLIQRIFSLEDQLKMMTMEMQKLRSEHLQMNSMMKENNKNHSNEELVSTKNLNDKQRMEKHQNHQKITSSKREVNLPKTTKKTDIPNSISSMSKKQIKKQVTIPIKNGKHHKQPQVGMTKSQIQRENIQMMVPQTTEALKPMQMNELPKIEMVLMQMDSEQPKIQIVMMQMNNDQPKLQNMKEDSLNEMEMKKNSQMDRDMPMKGNINMEMDMKENMNRQMNQNMKMKDSNKQMMMEIKMKEDMSQQSMNMNGGMKRQMRQDIQPKKDMNVQMNQCKQLKQNMKMMKENMVEHKQDLKNAELHLQTLQMLLQINQKNKGDSLPHQKIANAEMRQMMTQKIPEQEISACSPTKKVDPAQKLKQIKPKNNVPKPVEKMERMKQKGMMEKPSSSHLKKQVTKPAKLTENPQKPVKSPIIHKPKVQTTQNTHKPVKQSTIKGKPMPKSVQSSIKKPMNSKDHMLKSQKKMDQNKNHMNTMHPNPHSEMKPIPDMKSEQMMKQKMHEQQMMQKPHLSEFMSPMMTKDVMVEKMMMMFEGMSELMKIMPINIEYMDKQMMKDMLIRMRLLADGMSLGLMFNMMERMVKSMMMRPEMGQSKTRIQKMMSLITIILDMMMRMEPTKSTLMEEMGQMYMPSQMIGDLMKIKEIMMEITPEMQGLLMKDINMMEIPDIMPHQKMEPSEVIGAMLIEDQNGNVAKIIEA